MPIERFHLTDSEVAEIDLLLADLTSRYPSVEDRNFLEELGVVCHDLPRRLRGELYRLKLREPSSSILLLSGFPIDDQRIGATPTHWQVRATPPPTLREEMMLVLCAGLLGEPIAWSTQQDGHLVHDIMPIPGKEKEQLGSGSEEVLWWHTEDAFHPCRGDYLGMMCLRNFDRVATTFASLEEVVLTEAEKRLLFEPNYTIRPDESHLTKNRAPKGTSNGSPTSAYDAIEQMNSAPEKIAVFSGDPESPYVRIDPYFMDRVEDDEAQAALDSLIRQVDASLCDVVLASGEICFIDNFKGVHGRKPFKARYDGKDRWLKRVNVTRDLRKSRCSRSTSVDRVIGSR